MVDFYISEFQNGLSKNQKARRDSERLSTANPLSLKQMHPSAHLLSVFWETAYKLSGPGIHKLHKAMNFFRKDNYKFK